MRFLLRTDFIKSPLRGLKSMSRRRTHRTSSPSASTRRFHVAGTGSAFEDAEPIDEVYHEITA